MSNADLKKWIIETIGVGNAKNAAYYRPQWLKIHHPDGLKQIVEVTKFLGQDVSISARVACIMDDITSAPLCEYCKTNLTSFSRGRFGKYCSNKCQTASPMWRERRRATYLNKYGVENPGLCKEIMQKREQTCLERYGNINPTKNAKVKELISQKSKAAHAKVDRDEYERRVQKAKSTNLQKRGVEFSLQDPTVREKGKKTLLDRYGVDNAAKSEEVMEKIKETNQQRYGASWGLSNKEVREKITETFKQRHGVEHPSQIPEVRRRAEETTLQRLGVRFAAQSEEVQQRLQDKMMEKYGLKWASQAHMTPESLSKLNDPGWLKTANETKSLTEISKELGVGDKTVGDYFKRHGIEPIYHYRSSGEVDVASFLKELGIEDFKCNIRGVIGNRELDIYIPDHQVAIEYHGIYWHSENVSPDNRTKHFRLWRKCDEKKIRLYQIYEHEWDNPQKRLIWESIISSALGIADSIYARKCSVVELETKQAKNFYEANHLQGAAGASVHLGLIYGGELVSAMSFRFEDGQMELVRFCSLLGLRVVGGASKLLSAFCEKWQVDEIVTFSDNRYSNGALYQKLGFTVDGLVRPRYVYVHGNTREEKHRRSFQKKCLHRILPDYDPALSEWENVQRSQWMRLWDAGKVRWKIKA
jgi:G:T-mismatch repair DNA endonuclease (very short patch repair protein)